MGASINQGATPNVGTDNPPRGQEQGLSTEVGRMLVTETRLANRPIDGFTEPARNGERSNTETEPGRKTDWPIQSEVDARGNVSLVGADPDAPVTIVNGTLRPSNIKKTVPIEFAEANLPKGVKSEIVGQLQTFFGVTDRNNTWKKVISIEASTNGFKIKTKDGTIEQDYPTPLTGAASTVEGVPSTVTPTVPGNEPTPVETTTPDNEKLW